MSNNPIILFWLVNILNISDVSTTLYFIAVKGIHLESAPIAKWFFQHDMLLIFFILKILIVAIFSILLLVYLVDHPIKFVRFAAYFSFYLLIIVFGIATFANWMVVR